MSVERARSQAWTIRLTGLALSFVVSAAPVGLARDAASGEAPGIAIRGAKVITVNDTRDVHHGGVVLVKDGKIEAVGEARDVAIPDGYMVIDGAGMWAVPGMVEAHNHISGSLMDLNDGVYLSNPGLRTLDVVEAESRALKNAIAGGVTTTLLIPGSGNNMSGFGTLVKTAGSGLDEMLLRYPGSLKIAQAGNPERYWFGPQRSFMNWNTRQTLLRARKYHEAWTAYENGEGPEPEYDPTWDDFRGLFQKNFPTSVHTQIYQVVQMTIAMQHDELGLDVMLDHSTFDAYLLGKETVKRKIHVMNGPRQIHFERKDRKIYGNAAQWWAIGEGEQLLGVNTDAPVIPQEELALQCAMAVHFGMPQEHGIAAVTRMPALGMRIFDRVGSLETGKDADIALWTGDPIDPASACLKVLVNGKLAYDADRDGRRF